MVLPLDKRIRHRISQDKVDRNVIGNLKLYEAGEETGKMFIQEVTKAALNKTTKNRIIRLVTRPDGLSLSYRRLVGSQGSVGSRYSQVGSCEDMPWKCSCDKHPAYCRDWNDDEVCCLFKKKRCYNPSPFFE